MIVKKSDMSMEKKLFAENSVFKWIDCSENMSTISESSSSWVSLLNFRRHNAHVSIYKRLNVIISIAKLFHLISCHVAAEADEAHFYDIR